MTILLVGAIVSCDKQTDMTKLVISFRNFLNASKKGGCVYFHVVR